jgi:K+-sensing histidine kinase KdpD
MRYGIALLSVGAATGCTALVAALSPVTPFLLFVLAAGVGATYGGRGPGLVAVALALLASDFFFIPTRYTLTMNWQTLHLGLVYAFGALVSSLLAYRLTVTVRGRSSLSKRPEKPDPEYHRRNGRPPTDTFPPGS